MPEPSPHIHFAILPHAEKELIAGDVKGVGGLIY